jgi:HAE1 family hydrophobic/amphiphilic exporter-1
VQNDQVASWFNGERAIVLAIQRQPGSNTVETVDRDQGRARRLPAALPPALKLDVIYDRSSRSATRSTT